MSNNSRLVYSSDTGRIRPKAKTHSQKSNGDGIARVRRETKGRGGKTVTTISNLSLSNTELKELASSLKKLCGTGGSFKNGIIEIQGDNVDPIIEALTTVHGHKAKRAGG
tara:strand:- start:252 stop:581 length:330 start_codon:yes stop_codon:yes gene_type:complete